MPNYPPPSGMSAQPGGTRSVVPEPKQVTISFWLYISAAAVSLISLIISLASVAATRSALQHQLSIQGQKFSSAQLDALIAVTTTIAVVIGIVFIAAYVIFALFMRRGANWARIVLLILTVLSLFELTSGYGLGALRAALGVIATILIFLPAAREYFRTVKANKVGRLR